MPEISVVEKIHIKTFPIIYSSSIRSRLKFTKKHCLVCPLSYISLSLLQQHVNAEICIQRNVIAKYINDVFYFVVNDGSSVGWGGFGSCSSRLSERPMNEMGIVTTSPTKIEYKATNTTNRFTLNSTVPSIKKAKKKGNPKQKKPKIIAINTPRRQTRPKIFHQRLVMKKPLHIQSSPYKSQYKPGRLMNAGRLKYVQGLHSGGRPTRASLTENPTTKTHSKKTTQNGVISNDCEYSSNFSGEDLNPRIGPYWNQVKKEFNAPLIIIDIIKSATQ